MVPVATAVFNDASDDFFSSCETVKMLIPLIRYATSTFSSRCITRSGMSISFAFLDGLSGESFRVGLVLPVTPVVFCFSDFDLTWLDFFSYFRGDFRSFPKATSFDVFRFNAFSVFDDSCDDLLVRSGAYQIHVPQCVSQVQQVSVSIDHARDHRAAIQVDDLRALAPQRHRQARRAGKHDPPAPHGHRFHEGAVLVHSIDPAVGDDEIGGLGRHLVGSDDQKEKAISNKITFQLLLFML